MSRQTFTFVAQVPITLTVDVGGATTGPPVDPPPPNPPPPGPGGGPLPDALPALWSPMAYDEARYAYRQAFWFYAHKEPEAEHWNDFENLWKKTAEAGLAEHPEGTWQQVLTAFYPVLEARWAD